MRLRSSCAAENRHATKDHDFATGFAHRTLGRSAPPRSPSPRRWRTAATAALLRSLIELDVRRLYLREGCSSLFTYCTQVLHLEEGAAYNRIETARAARRFPSILDHIADGSLTLTSARLLAPHLTPDNFSDVLASARHKSKREVEVLVASLHPKTAVPESIRRVPAPPNVSTVAIITIGNSDRLPRRGSAESSSATVTGSQPAAATDSSRSPAVLTPLTAERYKVQLTISHDAYGRLRRVQDLLRHTVGKADLGEIFDRAITSLLTDLERRRCAATSAPRPRRQDTGGSQTYPGRREARGLEARCRTVRLHRHQRPLSRDRISRIPPRRAVRNRRPGHCREPPTPMSGAQPLRGAVLLLR